jgi:hypothetical protein
MNKHSYAQRWRIAANWYNTELDRLIAEGLAPKEQHDPDTHALLMHNVWAEHAKEIALDPPVFEALCQVFIKAGIPQALIALNLQAFVKEYGPQPGDVQKN